MQDEAAERGRTLALICLSVVLVGSLVSDYYLAGFYGVTTKTVLRYVFLVGFGVAIWRGVSWARKLLAGLLVLGALIAVYAGLQLLQLMPSMAVWTFVHAAINATVGAILFLAPSIATHEESRNPLLLA